VGETIKIVTIDIPAETHDQLEGLIRRQGNMELVGEAFDPVNLLLRVKDTQADVVIMGHEQPARIPGICTHLLAEYPDLLVLTIPAQSKHAFLYQRKISGDEVPYASPEDLIKVIDEAISSPMC
jgi:DNA-binding NarL/FixJ family response regulator